jgi:hypothetical protein
VLTDSGIQHRSIHDAHWQEARRQVPPVYWRAIAGGPICER